MHHLWMTLLHHPPRLSPLLLHGLPTLHPPALGLPRHGRHSPRHAARSSDNMLPSMLGRVWCGVHSVRCLLRPAPGAGPDALPHRSAAGSHAAKAALLRDAAPGKQHQVPLSACVTYF